MSKWVAVHGFSDGETVVDADSLNSPIFALASRTDYLKTQIASLLSGNSVFESVKLYSMPLLTTGSRVPSVGDAVCWYADSGSFGQALATTDLVDEFTTSLTAKSVGFLIENNGSTGTILTQGRLNMETAGSQWLLSGMIDTSETFRSGPYYLSTTSPGKLTASPSGVSVYMGLIVEDTANTGYGDYGVITPHVNANGNSHNHRAVPLYSQPVGHQYVAGADYLSPEGYHYVTGFEPVVSAETYDWVPRLICEGAWSGTADVEYTMWISTAAGTTRATSPAPTDFSDAVLHWTSSDAAEAQGSVRLVSFETFVDVGDYGLKVALENPGGYTPADGYDWDVIFDNQAATDDIDKRSWVLTLPTIARGWAENYQRDVGEHNQASDGGFSSVVFGGPFNEYSNTITVSCAEIHEILFTDVILDNDVVTIGSRTFQYTSTGLTTVSTYIAVDFDASETVCCTNLHAAIVALAITGVTAVLTDTSVLIGVPAGTTIEKGVIGAEASIAIATGGNGTGVLTAGAATADFLVYDEDYNNILSTANFWTAAEYYIPIVLTNGLQFMFVPYAADGTAASSNAIAIGDYFYAEVTDTSEGAEYRYNIGMHSGLNAFYPPVPSGAASLVLNGVELDSIEHFTGGTYLASNDTIYWYVSRYGLVPWAVDWVSATATGEDYNQQNMILHFARNVAGETGYVSSIRPKPGSAVRLTAKGTDAASSTGDLEIDYDVALSSLDAGLTGYSVVKGVSGNTLRYGPVVERIKTGAGLVATQQAGAPDGQGVVTLSLSSAASGYAGDFEEIALNRAKQETIGMFPFIKLLGWTTGGSNIDSGFTAKFRVPHNIVNAAYRVVVYATVFGLSDVTAVLSGPLSYAGLTFSYAVLPDVTAIGGASATGNLVEDLIVPEANIAVEVPMGDNTRVSKFYEAYDPILIHNYPTETDANKLGYKANVLGSPLPSAIAQPSYSDELAVRPGALVGVSFARAGITGITEYTGELGIINLRWMLVTV